MSESDDAKRRVDGPVIRGPWGQPPTKGPKLPDRTKATRRRITLGIIAAVVVFVISWAGPIATVITDYLWYADLGHTVVFWVTTLSGWAVGAVFAAVFFVLLFVNIRVARALAPKVRPIAPASTDPPWMQVVSQLGELAQGRWVDWLLFALAIVFAWIAGAGASTGWIMFQQALHATPFSGVDPQFNINISFFVFQLPALRAIVD
ncbi:MAG: UPF0182 family protein, partial [Actinomycetes bacterium]